MRRVGIIFYMTHLRSTDQSRTLTVVLSESDWQALRAVEPDAVGWLQQRIRERLGNTSAQEARGNAATASNTPGPWDHDEY